MINSWDLLGQNRYITQFDILNLGGSGGTQLHVGVGVDTWICNKKNGKWERTGKMTFDFSIDWEAGVFNFLLGVVGQAQGKITITSGLNLHSPVTVESKLSEDIKMREIK